MFTIPCHWLWPQALINPCATGKAAARWSAIHARLDAVTGQGIAAAHVTQFNAALGGPAHDRLAQWMLAGALGACRKSNKPPLMRTSGSDSNSCPPVMRGKLIVEPT
jgi:hypothetical protein